ncbi:MAG: hypothetical protein AAF367_03540 [Pseudomonadota bacterium]
MFALAPLFAPPQLLWQPKRVIPAGAGFDPTEMMKEAGVIRKPPEPAEDDQEPLAA